MHYFSKGNADDRTVDNIVVQIVKGEIRSIGDGHGITWINRNHERHFDLATETFAILKGQTPELRNQLKRIYEDDIVFLTLLLGKMYNHYGHYRFDLGTWGRDAQKRQELLNHVPEKEKFAIFRADDNGRSFGPAIAVGEVMTMGDWQIDRREAVVDGLVNCLGWTEEDARKGNWYTASRYDEYIEDVRERYDELQTEIEMLERYSE